MFLQTAGNPPAIPSSKNKPKHNTPSDYDGEPPVMRGDENVSGHAVIYEEEETEDIMVDGQVHGENPGPATPLSNISSNNITSISIDDEKNNNSSQDNNDGSQLVRNSHDQSFSPGEIVEMRTRQEAVGGGMPDTVSILPITANVDVKKLVQRLSFEGDVRDSQDKHRKAVSLPYPHGKTFSGKCCHLLLIMKRNLNSFNLVISSWYEVKIALIFITV